MKKQFLVLVAASFSVLVSCNNSENRSVETTTDSEVTSTATASTDVAPPTVNDGMPVFYSLETKQPVVVIEDENTHQYMDASTQQPVTYYYEPISNDTFDMRGRLVNNALILTDGKYSLDDAKIKSNDNAFKIKSDEWKMKWGKDGDNKMKDDDMKIKDKEDKYKVKTDDVKIKDKGDKYKVKTDDTKIKVKDGEVKIKDKQ
ncbi:MAG: hypothetical protein ABIR31_00735 [Ginsengibacter sp.]